MVSEKFCFEFEVEGKFSARIWTSLSVIVSLVRYESVLLGFDKSLVSNDRVSFRAKNVQVKKA